MICIIVFHILGCLQRQGSNTLEVGTRKLDVRNCETPPMKDGLSKMIIKCMLFFFFFWSNQMHALNVVCVDNELQTWNYRFLFLYLSWVYIECHFVIKKFFFPCSCHGRLLEDDMKIHYVWLVQNCILPSFVDVKCSRE